MAQDEWGHGRLTYALLSDFGDEPFAIEHERESGAYHSMEVLDLPFGSWNRMIAGCLLIDTALAVQYDALTESAYTPVRTRVQKLLEEEVLHFQYASGWVPRIAGSRLGAELRRDLAEMLPRVLRWFGPPASPAARQLRESGLVGGDPESLRTALLQKVAPVLDHAGVSGDLGLVERRASWSYESELDFGGWREAERRFEAGGPDAETIARVRGDRNRLMLLD